MNELALFTFTLHEHDVMLRPTNGVLRHDPVGAERVLARPSQEQLRRQHALRAVLVMSQVPLVVRRHNAATS